MNSSPRRTPMLRRAIGWRPAGCWYFSLWSMSSKAPARSAGCIAQPLSYFLKQAHGWTPLQVTAYLAIFNFPWIIKPIYGAISDFVPLFGLSPQKLSADGQCLRDRWFLVGDSDSLRRAEPGVGACSSPPTRMAISSTVCGAVLVENGQRLGDSGRFVNQQWLWFNAAAMIAAIMGGQLAQRSAAYVCTSHRRRYRRRRAGGGFVRHDLSDSGAEDARGRRCTSQHVRRRRRCVQKARALDRRRCFRFSTTSAPALSTPLYYVMTDNLKFSQGYIGILGSIASAGWIVGALVLSPPV